MDAMYTNKINTSYGEKEIEVFSCNIVDFDREIDILITSAFRGSYYPTPGTMFKALYDKNICIEELAENADIDMRDLCSFWLSKEVHGTPLKIGRIGCVEMSGYSGINRENEIMTLIKACFRMLDVASVAGIKSETVAMPLLGAGRQHISSSLTLIPLVKECIDFLKRNEYVKKVYFIDYNAKNAFDFASTMQNMYSVMKEDKRNSSIPSGVPGVKVFLSYTTKDKNIADNLCSKLESRGIKVWYAPRDVSGNDYATAIVNAISECTHFVTIISKDSMMSEHVLNEIDLAFSELRRNIRFMPLRIDDEALRPAFSYYLSRQHWMDAHVPPIEQRLEEFVEKILSEI